MSCLSISLDRIGDSSASATRVGGSSVSATKLGGMYPEFERVGGIKVSASRAAKMTCRMGLVCGTDLGVGYLYASDALLITIENGRLIVKNRN